MLTRDQIIGRLASSLPAHECIRAAWLGGSDANARADAVSDVDLYLVVEPGSIERSAAHLEADLSALSPIRLRLRLPMPTWHGFHQAFYQLRDAPEHLMIDWLMVERGQPHPWLEIERHGTPRVLFDKDQVVHPVHADRATLRAAAARRVEEARLKFAMFRHMPPKLARRDLPVDAGYFYQALVLRPLVDLLRSLHCPDRHDFGFRCLRDDLPPDVYAELRVLMYPPGVEALPDLTARASALFDRAAAAWDAQSPVSGGRSGPA